MQGINNDNVPINILIPQQGDVVYYGDRFGPTGYELGRSVADGGEGKIYNGTGGKAYKIYKPHRLTGAAITKLEAMVSQKYDLSDSICWPEALLFEPSDRRIPVGFSMKNINASGEDIPTLEQLINNPNYHGKKWDRKSLVRVCIKIVEAFAQLHKFEILMGDVNPRNILVDRNCNALFIDVDSYQFGEYICPVGMPEYISPRIHKLGGAYSEIKRTKDDELFAITTLIYRILFLNALPFPIDEADISDSIKNYRFRFENENVQGDDVYIWKNLTPKLRQAFYNAYTKGEYIDEAAWKERLNELYDWMDRGWVSDNLLLVDAIDESDIGKITFIDIACSDCGNNFKMIENRLKKDALCPQCLKDRKINRRVIHRFFCKECGKAFTVNPWDSNNADSENCICPDCDKTIAFPPESLSDLTVLQKNYEAILKNLTPEDKEDYI